MAEFPALPLFTDAYMADTRHLSAAQHGAYILLLMTAWRMPDCTLPDDDIFLSRCASMDLRTWKKNKTAVMAFWKKDEAQRYYQPRLLDERKYVAHKRSKNSKAAKTRWLKNKETGKANAMPNECQNDAPTPTPTPTVISDSNKLESSCSEPAQKPKKQSCKYATYTTKDGRFFSWQNIVDYLWDSYPRVGRAIRGKAKFDEELAKLINREGKNEQEWQIIITNLATKITEYRHYCEATGEKQPDPERWLRHKRYEDTYEFTPEQRAAIKRRPGDKGNPMDALRIALEDQTHRISSD